MNQETIVKLVSNFIKERQRIKKSFKEYGNDTKIKTTLEENQQLSCDVCFNSLHPKRIDTNP